MATPSSSGTSPSPALSFALPASENSTEDPNDVDQAEREERRKKLLARMEFAKITRALRTTLAFASYKTKHNVANVPLRNLEAQVAQRANNLSNNLPPGQASPSLFPSSYGNDKKRKSNSSANNASFFNSPLSHGTNNYGIGGSGLGTNASTSSMSMQSPHSSYTFPPPSPSMASGPANPSKSLFASILSLPPAKRARTIHNPEAPPVAPPLPPQTQGRRSPKKGVKKGKEPAANSKGRAADRKGKAKERDKKSVAGRGRANSISSVRTHSSFGGDKEKVNDTDMKAAETLTDLLFSRTGGAASPRSSFSAPTSASRTAPLGPTPNSHSLSQASSGSSLAASAASQRRAHTRTGSNASTVSVGTSIMELDHHAPVADPKTDTRRSATPTITPRLATRTAGGLSAGSSLSSQASHVFGAPSAPEQRAVDSEAADLMLLLANSPSPARPTAPRDHDISRNAYAAGRVLFPSGPNGAGQASEHGGLGASPRGLARSMGRGSPSSVGSGEGIRENGKRTGSDTATSPPSSQGEVSPPHSQKGAAGPPTGEHDGTIPLSSSRPSIPTLSLGQLLPSPPSPTQTGPQTPAPAFHLSDYVNMTPSPAAPISQPSQTSSGLPPPQSSSSQTQLFPSSNRYGSTVSVSSPLRKGFDREGTILGVTGRKLFETEPRGASGSDNTSGNGNNAPRKMRFREGVDGTGTLGSGIDLVQT